MSRLLLQTRIGKIAIAIVVMVTLAGCGTGAPSVNHPTVAPSSGNNSIDAPAQPTTASTEVVIPPTATTPSQPELTPTATVINVAVGGETALPTEAATPEPEISPTPEATERPAPPEPAVVGVSDIYETGPSDRPEVALTFDAGADRGFAEQILDTLKEYGIKASFGITGMWASENPDLVKRMADEGHQIFNHTWSHESFTGFSTGEGTGITDTADRTQELERTNDEIMQITGGYDTRPYWRPPYGDYDEGVLEDMASDGYTATILWSCDTLGWNGATVQEILDKCAVDVPNGAIILMHVGNGSLDAESLPQMIEMMEADGFTFVTIEELLQP